MPVDGLYQEAAPEPLVQAVAANSPASASDKLYVVVPSFDPAAKWGPVVWTPRGNTLPTAGSLCLLARDDQGLWWVVAWSGAWTGGSGPPSGSAGGDLAGSYPNPTFSTAGLAKMLQPANDLSDVAIPATALSNLSGIKGVTSPTMELAAGGATVTFSGANTATATVTTGLGSFSNWVAYAMLVGTSGQYLYWSVAGTSASVTFNATSSVVLTTTYTFQWLVLAW